MSGGTKQYLLWGHGSSADVAADQVCVGCFEISGRGDVAGENAVAESGGEALDLIFDALGHIYG